MIFFLNGVNLSREGFNFVEEEFWGSQGDLGVHWCCLCYVANSGVPAALMHRKSGSLHGKHVNEGRMSLMIAKT